MRVYGTSLTEMNRPNYCVYRITHLYGNIHYYGSKTAKGFKPKDIGTKYVTGSTDQNFVKELTEQPDNFKVKIVSIHVTKEEAVAKESRLHAKFDVGRNPKFYNRANQTMSGFMCPGKIVVKDKYGNNYSVDVLNSNYLSGELKHINTNKAVVRDQDGNTMQVDITDPRYSSGELVHIATGTLPVRDKDGNTLQVSVNDPRFLSGELKHIATGHVSVKDQDGNTMQVDIKDDRYISGELVGINKGRITVKDKNENTMQIDSSDIRYLSGELVAEGKDIAVVKDEEGNIFRIHIDHPDRNKYVGCNNGRIMSEEEKSMRTKSMNRSEVKEKLKIASKESQNRPEVKKKKSETLKQVMNSPQIKKKLRDYWDTHKNIAKDSIWVKHLTLLKNIQIRFDQLDKYKKEGYVRGRLNKLQINTRRTKEYDGGQSN